MIEVESLKLDDTLTNVQTKYHTRFRKGVQNVRVGLGMICHRGGVPQHVYPCTRWKNAMWV